MAQLRRKTILKYMIFIKEDITYPELITKIHHHIQPKKTSNFEASKLNQDILLGGKCKLNSYVSSSKT